MSRLDPGEVADLTRIIISEDPIEDSDLVKPFHLGDDRQVAIDKFKQPGPSNANERSRPENRFARTELLIVCDMLLTGFDAPILQTMYLDKAMRDHTLLQAIARVNRPYRELKQAGLILDYYGVFENLNEALNFDKNELGEVAFPTARLLAMFEDEFRELIELFAGIPRDGRHSTLMQALVLLNDEDDRRERFEILQRNVRILYETVQPEEALRDYIADYTWLMKLYMLYRKKFYPKEHFEISPEDGAKTRALIREYVDVKELEDEFPSYTLDANYLTRIQGTEPDAKALDIEGMLDAELRVRLDEDEDVRPLSERLNRIIEQKRAGTLAGVALLEELEKLTADVVEIIEEADRPVEETVAREVQARSDSSPEMAAAVAGRLVERAGELCFPGWLSSGHMDTELYREITIVLVREFNALDLRGSRGGFVERVIRILRKARFQEAAS
jgi:type I restriction enzyme R subunit